MSSLLLYSHTTQLPKGSSTEIYRQHSDPGQKTFDQLQHRAGLLVTKELEKERIAAERRFKSLLRTATRGIDVSGE